MAYADEIILRNNVEFQGRVDACVFEQSGIFKDDGRPDIAALAGRHLRNPTEATIIWMPWVATAPGFADHAADPSAITDGMLLAAVQAQFPTVAGVYYGAP